MSTGVLVGTAGNAYGTRYRRNDLRRRLHRHRPKTQLAERIIAPATQYAASIGGTRKCVPRVDRNDVCRTGHGARNHGIGGRTIAELSRASRAPAAQFARR